MQIRQGLCRGGKTQPFNLAAVIMKPSHAQRIPTNKKRVFQNEIYSPTDIKIFTWNRSGRFSYLWPGPGSPFPATRLRFAGFSRHRFTLRRAARGVFRFRVTSIVTTTDVTLSDPRSASRRTLNEVTKQRFDQEFNKKKAKAPATPRFLRLSDAEKSVDCPSVPTIKISVPLRRAVQQARSLSA